MPAGRYLLISSRGAVQGSTTEKTFSSRMRRAMSCVYCEPKSRMTIDCSSTDDFLLLRVFRQVGKTPTTEARRHGGMRVLFIWLTRRNAGSKHASKSLVKSESKARGVDRSPESKGATEWDNHAPT